MTEQLEMADGQGSEVRHFGTRSADIDRLTRCPECGSSEYVNITAAPSHRRNEWVGTCSSCETEWTIVDA